ncbi:GntR family transcriptional regulator [Actinotalea sp. M2MS4P-6]|uniref:GntR family transcriptional regulator n=1 Tax=Actinotalea sp. M2MS4P-6 TaxID=2983762 RepID=UPI0021E3CB84|nr:GntR family transcriptional regulator [Actinotalea sp. M2MS4P-6]MCV2393737.1 GntR family transcriptional regulator [Actinotalea sp. M2MS4P-6]
MTGAPTASRSRAEVAAETIGRLARDLDPGARLGNRAELREACAVSVGTLHEALRLLQSTGEVVVRTGPGGGVFKGESSALSDLVRSVRGQAGAPVDYAEIARVLDALAPLVIDDAIRGLDDDARTVLRRRADALAAADHSLRDVVRASLELFATIVSTPPPGVLRTVVASILRVQLDLLRRIDTHVDPDWRAVVDQHVAAATAVVDAILAGDLDAALAARARPEFGLLFERVAQTPWT